MAFKLCCSCDVTRRTVTWRRWVKITEILPGGERTNDTTDWVLNTSNLAHNVCSPLMFFENDTSIWMKPIRCELFSTTQGNASELGHATADERCLSTLSGSTIAEKHTYSIMTLGSAGVPESSHLHKVRMTEWSWVPPVWQSWWAVPSTRIPPVTTNEDETTPYRGYLEAYRLWIDGNDATGIITLSSSIGFWSKNQLEHNRPDDAFYLNDSIGQTSISTLLNETSTIAIDLWFRVDIEGWGSWVPPGTAPIEGDVDGNVPYTSNGVVWLPTIKISRSAVWSSGGDTALNNTYGGLGNIGSYGNSNQRLLSAPPYYFDLQFTGVATKMPRGWNWSLSFGSESVWVPGGAQTVNLNDESISSTYKVRLYPTFSEVVTPDIAWNDSDPFKIDERIIKPTTGDGLVAFYGPNDPASSPAIARWRCSSPDFIGSQITKVTIWFFANCDGNSDGNITEVKFIYTVSGTTYTRTATPSVTTPTRSWFSVEFTGSEITGLTSTSNPRAQLAAETATLDAFVEVDSLYIEYEISGDWTITRGDTSYYAQHANGDAISFQFGREVPEIVLKRVGNLYSSSGVLIQASEMTCLYRPADNDAYQSDVFPGSATTVEPAGTWDPNSSTVFKICGYNPSPRSFEAVVNAGVLPTTGTQAAIRYIFPTEITINKN